MPHTSTQHLPAKTREFYRAATEALDKAAVPFLVGGAYAFARYTGIERHTKDFDIFVRETEAKSALDVLAAAGYRTELTFPHWLGKAYCDGDFIDVIYSSGNGIAIVDDGWFEHCATGEVLGRELRLCPAEEMIWSKAFVIERERYDGADICHLIKARGHTMDWARLLRRFDRNWRVLLSHLVIFGFVYPGERDAVPKEVMQDLLERMKGELDASPTEERVCQGTLLSRAQYLVDIQAWGYQDARLREDVHMTPENIAQWTAAIEGATANYVEHKGTGSAGRSG